MKRRLLMILVQKNLFLIIKSTTVLGWSSAISGSRPPNFFCDGGGSHFWGPKNFENLKFFEKLWLKNAIKMNLGVITYSEYI